MILDKTKTAIDTFIAYEWWLRIIVTSRFTGIRNWRHVEKRHALLLAWFFPPFVTGGSYRLTALAKHGSQFGWEFSVFSAPHSRVMTRAGASLLQSVPKSVSVTRLVQPSLGPSHNWFPRVDGGFLNALATYDLAGDVSSEVRPSIIMASGPPFHNFIAAYYIAKRYKAKLVLDYRDEWTECPFDFIEVGNADRGWEARCLAAAHAVFFTTQRQLDHQMVAFPQLARQKCHIIPNGWEPGDFAHLNEFEEDAASRRGKLVLSFVGNLANHTLPGEFLSALDQILSGRADLVDRLLFRFVGQRNQAATDQLSAFRYRPLIELVETVPKQEANRIMRQSSGLLLFNNHQMDRYIPGKLYDYLASGRPLIVFGQGGEIGDLVTRLQAGYVVRAEDVFELEKALDQIANGEAIGRNRTMIEEWLANHTRSKMTLRMLDVFNRLLGEA